jgi:hypothetical protein
MKSMYTVFRTFTAAALIAGSVRQRRPEQPARYDPVVDTLGAIRGTFEQAGPRFARRVLTS